MGIVTKAGEVRRGKKRLSRRRTEMESRVRTRKATVPDSEAEVILNLNCRPLVETSGRNGYLFGVVG